MSAVVRGYHSVIIKYAALTTTPVDCELRGIGSGVSAHLRIKNTGANIARLYLASGAYITLAVGEVLSEPIEVSKFQVASDSGTTNLEILAMCIPTATPPVI